jgi:DNA-binding transcriptional regulator LsrR (DeoR family)
MNAVDVRRLEVWTRFTHDEIAQMIGSSRETVTRSLTALRRRNIIQITSNSILIRDRRALENMLESRDKIEPVVVPRVASFEPGCQAGDGL